MDLTPEEVQAVMDQRREAAAAIRDEPKQPDIEFMVLECPYGEHVEMVAEVNRRLAAGELAGPPKFSPLPDRLVVVLVTHKG